MNYTNAPENGQYCKVKFHRVGRTPEYLVKLGVDPIREFDSEADEVWYNAETEEFYAGDAWLCDLSEVVYWKPSSAPIVGLAYKN